MNKRNVIISILLIILVILLLMRKQVANVFRAGDNVSLETSVNEYKLDPLEYIPRGLNFGHGIWTSDAMCGCKKSGSGIPNFIPTVNQIIAKVSALASVAPVPVNCGPRRKIRNTNRARNGIDSKYVYWNQCEDLEDERRYGKYAVT